jgi:hypothetical protein
MSPQEPTERCPFAQPGLPSSSPTRAIYCRLPGGRVHIPSADDIRRFCAAGAFGLCPVRQRWAPMAAASGWR